MQRRFYLFLLVTILYSCTALSQGSSAGNPVMYADVPDNGKTVYHLQG